MQDDNNQQANASLEHQLRNMIITNATQQSSNVQQPNLQNQYPGPHRAHQGHHPGAHGPSNYQQFSYSQHHQHPRHVVNHVHHQPGPFPHQHRGGHVPVNYRAPSMHNMHNHMPSRGPPQPAMHVDPDDFQRGPPRGGMRGGMQPRQARQLYQPQPQPFAAASGPQYESQWHYLDSLVTQEVPLVEMSPEEIASKDAFRLHLEDICQTLKAKYLDEHLQSLTLQSFGSLSSGFASAGSDMDLAIVTDSLDAAEQKHLSLHEASLPRLLEKELLVRGIGARLLTRTRVPIIKICELPPLDLLNALKEERRRWESLPDDEKYSSANPSAGDSTAKQNAETSETVPNATEVEVTGSEESPITEQDVAQEGSQPASNLHESSTSTATPSEPVGQDSPADAQDVKIAQQADANAPKQRPNNKKWTRERVAGPLDFPKSGVGIQCDINFFNPLGLFNTKLLRCYSKCDPRVRPMILFIKAWAKRRKINSSYSGSLSSYGYVLMVLHYLVNVARPPVLPNLQLEAARLGLPPSTVDGWEVRFFGDEDEIVAAAARGQLTQNHDPLGVLLRGFFQYFASTSGGQGFIWMQDVLSLRSPGGVLKKEEKGWTGAKTEVGDNQKEVRHRYLFAIEDPFELTHNVARTVTHNGIVAIRDEFRRAWRIIQAVGRGLAPHDGELFEQLDEESEAITTTPRTHSSYVSQAPQASQGGSMAQGYTNKAAIANPPAPRVVPVDGYAQAFPTLGGPPRGKEHGVRVVNSVTQSIPRGQPRFPRLPNGNNQKSTRQNKEGSISGDQTRNHLQNFKKQQQMN